MLRWKKKKIQNCKKLKTFVSLQKDFEQKITSYIYNSLYIHNSNFR